MLNLTPMLTLIITHPKPKPNIALLKPNSSFSLLVKMLNLLIIMVMGINGDVCSDDYDCGDCL